MEEDKKMRIEQLFEDLLLEDEWQIINNMPKLLAESINIKNSKIIKERPLYDVKEEIWNNDIPGVKDQTIVACYTKSGEYIGDEKTAKYICDKKGIIPEKRDASHCVCSIGFQPDEQKWYGWSHRAMFGFGIGYKVKKGDSMAKGQEFSRDSSAVDVGFEAKTLEDCKKLAYAFADSVS